MLVAWHLLVFVHQTMQLSLHISTYECPNLFGIQAKPHVATFNLRHRTSTVSQPYAVLYFTLTLDYKFEVSIFLQVYCATDFVCQSRHCILKVA